jgi:hypothetical protein
MLYFSSRPLAAVVALVVLASAQSAHASSCADVSECQSEIAATLTNMDLVLSQLATSVTKAQTAHTSAQNTQAAINGISGSGVDGPKAAAQTHINTVTTRNSEVAGINQNAINSRNAIAQISSPSASDVDNANSLGTAASGTISTAADKAQEAEDASAAAIEPADQALANNYANQAASYAASADGSANNADGYASSAEAHAVGADAAATSIENNALEPDSVKQAARAAADASQSAAESARSASDSAAGAATTANTRSLEAASIVSGGDTWANKKSQASTKASEAQNARMAAASFSFEASAQEVIAEQKEIEAAENLPCQFDLELTQSGASCETFDPLSNLNTKVSFRPGCRYTLIHCELVIEAAGELELENGSELIIQGQTIVANAGFVTVNGLLTVEGNWQNQNAVVVGEKGVINVKETFQNTATGALMNLGGVNILSGGELINEAANTEGAESGLALGVVNKGNFANSGTLTNVGSFSNEASFENLASGSIRNSRTPLP